jgi:uncharacterized protein (DUF169 family)
MDKETRRALGKILGLEKEPVALRWFTKPPGDLPRLDRPRRFCAKVGQALHGASFYATEAEEACQGGARYCGLRDGKRQGAAHRSGEFLVAMGLYRSVPAVQRAWRRFPFIEPGIFQALGFAPLGSAPYEPEVVFVLADARQAMQLLHANAYDAGAQALGADAAPICSSMAAMPYLTGKLTYGFGDVGARNHMELGREGVMVSIPGSALGRIVSNLREMKAKKAFRD